jgi:hypothetical protein
MDWLTILIIFLFFVLPMIQEVAKRRNAPPPEVEPHDYGEEEPWEEEVEEGAVARRQEEEANAWESLGLEGIFTGKTPSAPVPAPPPRAERAPPEVRRTPAPEPEPAPVYAHREPEREDAGLERLRAYERKVRDATRRPVPEAPPPPGFTREPRTAREARTARGAVEVSYLGEVERRESARAARLRTLIGGRESVREAILLREALGPPRSLDPYP